MGEGMPLWLVRCSTGELYDRDGREVYRTSDVHRGLRASRGFKTSFQDTNHRGKRYLRTKERTVDMLESSPVRVSKESLPVR
jgi:hypothetical protein